MKRISKQDTKRIEGLVNGLRSSFGEVEEAHAAMREAIEAYNAKISAFNEAVDDARSFADDIVREIEEYVGERSEKWQQSDAAPSYEEWRSAWENWGSERLEEAEVPDAPDDAVIGELEELPQEPSL